MELPGEIDRIFENGFATPRGYCRNQLMVGNFTGRPQDYSGGDFRAADVESDGAELLLVAHLLLTGWPGVIVKVVSVLSFL